MSCPEETRDRFLGGRFELIQPKGWGLRAGLDALLLAASVPSHAKGRAVDLGAGSGAAGFALATRCEGLDVVLAERDAQTLALARRSILLPENAPLASRLDAVEVDILASRPAREAAGLSDGGFDLAITNPPFHPPGGRLSPDVKRAAATAAPERGFLQRWVAVSAALLRPGGILALIARPDGLAEILAGAENRLGDLRILAVHTKEGEPAIRILVHARRASRAPLRLLPPLVLRDATGAPYLLERMVGEGTAAIDLGLA
ncbi:methyltransferase [Aureimonas leprariae]|uniref:Methyltransferase n=1 Tax=Plantimonas leprariae TaxID=2615207 RepID=A0A7V7PQA1_9HYPH|nr:methyltransferase [Aureimonas leprariae]KAB0680270.1 methyltransferase [Aureimonas leprariae]